MNKAIYQVKWAIRTATGVDYMSDPLSPDELFTRADTERLEEGLKLSMQYPDNTIVLPVNGSDVILRVQQLESAKQIVYTEGIAE